MKKIILASTSPRRQELMKLLGVPFEVIPSDFDEDKVTHKNPKALVKKLALSKALAVSEKVKDAIVIGSDTVAFFENESMSKPKDKFDAERMLKLIQGRSHFIHTGYAIVDSV